MRGKIHPPRTAILRMHVGTASDDCGNQFDMFTVATNGCPGIYSHTTGKTFTLTWQDIIEMAVEMGVQTTDRAPEAADATDATPEKEAA